ncbi:calcium/calmodulin-dependent protein kinase type 1 [Aphelenchoides avenae]|nr:calcium/calmodulin-dependent protein kinase type 1 [Aphelenchus avenae]
MFPKQQLDELKANVKLSDSGLTAAWLLDTLWERCAEFQKALGSGSVAEIDAKDISEGKGYVSKVYKTVVQFNNATEDSYTVMMKVPTTECMEKMMDSFSKGDESEKPTLMADVFACHNVECKAYEALRGLDVLPLPTIWYTQEAGPGSIGVILMEDLAEDGTTLGFMSAMTLQQAKNIMRYFASFHAYQLCLTPEEWKKWDAIPLERRFWIDDFMGTNAKMVTDMIDTVPEFRAGELKDLIKKYLPCISKKFAEYALIERPKQLGLPLVYCHGDTGPHNMFFKKNDDGMASNEITAFIDWQIGFKGSQMFDLARILYAFCDGEVRREAEQTIVDDYFRLLTDELKKEGRKVDFEAEQLREALALAGLHQTVMNVCYPAFMESRKHEHLPQVFEAWRQKFILRARMALKDAVASLEKYAPQFIGN